MTQKRPQTDEYAPSIGATSPVCRKRPTSDSRKRPRRLAAIVGCLTEAQADYRYEPSKWSVKEVVGHVVDTERIFAYRLLRIARGDQTPLSGFEQDDYVREGNFSARSLAELLAEFGAVRRATTILIRSLPDKAWIRRGSANQKEVTVTALAFIIAGHELHHRAIVEQRYLPSLRTP